MFKMVDSNSDINDKKYLTTLKGASILFGITGLAALSGFGFMFARTRKNNPEDFHAGLASSAGQDNGAKLALRALGRATVYSVGGFSLFCFAVWKLMGVHSLEEFTKKMQSIMPKISPENNVKEDINWDELFKTKKTRSMPTNNKRS